jgi:hypothetical protein
MRSKTRKRYAPLKLILCYFSQPHHSDSLIEICSFFQNSITDLCAAVGCLRDLLCNTASYTNIKDCIKFSKKITTLLSAQSETFQLHTFNKMAIHKNYFKAFVINKIILKIKIKFKSSYMFRPAY